MAKFRIFTDSCSDLSTSSRQQYDIDYFRMNVVLDGEEKPADLDWKEFTYEEFYGWMYAGRKLKTTQVPAPEFEEKMTKVLEKGEDVLYVSCSNKLSGSINTFQLVKEELQEKFPDRKIIGVDSLAATGSEGQLAIFASELRAQGKTIEETAAILEEKRTCFTYFATVDDLKYLKNAGRIKGSKAFFGNIIGVKPIIMSDAQGNNLAIKNARGTKASLEEIFEHVKEGMNEETKVVYVGSGKAEASAAKLKERFEKELGLEVVEYAIGPIIGTSCGPGVVSACFRGKEVTRFEGDGIKE